MSIKKLYHEDYKQENYPNCVLRLSGWTGQGFIYNEEGEIVAEVTKKTTPTIGKKYKVWREGLYLGVAEFCDDPNIGKSFLILQENNDLLVCIPDKWELVDYKKITSEIKKQKNQPYKRIRL